MRQISRSKRQLHHDQKYCCDSDTDSFFHNLPILLSSDFLIIAFAIFLFIRLITKLTTKKQAEVPATPPAPPAPTKEEVLLTEIRDLLKEKNS